LLRQLHSALGGVRMDSIPKEGGNTYAGVWRTLGSKGSLQNDNITDALRPFISVNTQLDYSYDTNIVFGGPIKKNKLWFLLAQRVSRTNNLIAFPVGVLPAFLVLWIRRAVPEPEEWHAARQQSGHDHQWRLLSRTEPFLCRCALRQREVLRAERGQWRP
jgi:hypothetical protein